MPTKVPLRAFAALSVGVIVAATASTTASATIEDNYFSKLNFYASHGGCAITLAEVQAGDRIDFTLDSVNGQEVGIPAVGFGGDPHYARGNSIDDVVAPGEAYVPSGSGYQLDACLATNTVEGPYTVAEVEILAQGIDAPYRLGLSNSGSAGANDDAFARPIIVQHASLLLIMVTPNAPTLGDECRDANARYVVGEPQDGVEWDFGSTTDDGYAAYATATPLRSPTIRSPTARKTYCWRSPEE